MGLKDDRVEQYLRSCGSEFQMWGPKQEKVRKPRVLRLYCWISSMRVSEEERRCTRRIVDMQQLKQETNQSKFAIVSRTDATTDYI